MGLFSGIRYYLLSDKNKFSTLKRILGFIPSNLKLYEQAFTHKSVVNETNRSEKDSNERLEYLGDAILDAVIAEFLFIKYPYANEGFLTKMKSKLVSRNFLNRLAKDLDLDTFLETSQDVRNSRSIYGDAFEALIGAIFLDKGFDVTKRFILEKVIKDHVDLESIESQETDFKSKLIEWSQKTRKKVSFKTEEIEDSNINFYKATLLVNGAEKTKGEGRTKKAAEQRASEKFFARFLRKSS